MSRGRFITFEGGEGAGKSTQIGRLAEALAEEGIPVVATREPGGSPGAEKIRTLLLDPAAHWDPPTEVLLHFAARADHYTTRIAPALKAGKWVLCDRFADSTLAYQGYGKGLPLRSLNALNRFTLEDLAPDLTFVLDVPVALGLERAAARSTATDRFEALGRDFHERLRRGFRRIAAQKRERCVLIDSSGDIEAVQGLVREAVVARLGVRLPGP